MKLQVYDVIVVGAGPAGASAARAAVNSGLDVLLLDRKTNVGIRKLHS